MVQPAVESFEEFAVFAIPRLRRLAFAYCQDWHHADDVVQTALEKLCGAWVRVRAGEAYGYARTTLLRQLISENRRAWRHHEVSTDDVARHEPDPLHQDGPASEAELYALLAGLSPEHRAVVVLRYFENLSVTETAQTLGCSEGTVKSRAHTARQHLRVLLTHPFEQGAPR